MVLTRAEVEALVMLGVERWTVVASPQFEFRDLAVVLEVGHSDIGPTGQNDTVMRARNFTKARELLCRGRRDVINRFVSDILQLQRAIQEKWAIDDGSHQYAIACIVGPGVDGLVTPIEGFSIAWRAETLELCQMIADEQHWDDLF